MNGQTMKSALLAILICATLVVATGFTRPQSTSRHALEGAYEVSLTRIGQADAIKFTMSLSREAGKWAGEVRNMPVPVTVKEIAVTGENSLTGTATVNLPRETITITVKADGSKITCDVNVNNGENTATLTATKKASQEKTTIEGTYDAQAVLDDGNTLSLELVIRRVKPADK